MDKLSTKEEYLVALNAVFDEHKGTRIILGALISLTLGKLRMMKFNGAAHVEQLTNYLYELADDPKSNFRMATGKRGGYYRFSDSPDGKFHVALESIFKVHGEIKLPISYLELTILKDVQADHWISESAKCKDYLKRISQSPGSGYLLVQDDMDGACIVKHEGATKVPHPGANEFTRKVEELLHLYKTTSRYDSDTRINLVVDIIKTCANQISS